MASTKDLIESARPIVDTDKTRTVSYMHRVVRQKRHPELFIGLSDDLINMSSFRPTSEIQARFESVFSREQRENLKIVLHPWFKRWTLFERTTHKGQPLWHPVCMFHDTPEEQKLPADLLEAWGNNAEHLRGKVGDFRNVSYQDLEFVERCDIRKYGVDEVVRFIIQFDDAKETEAQKYMDDYLEDFMSYNFWLAMRDAQAHYSQPWSTRSVTLKSDPAKYKIIQHDGWTEKVRVYGEEGDLNEMKVLSSDELRNKQVPGFDPANSISDRAILEILSAKNLKYLAQTGESLWEKVTGNKVIWTDFESKNEHEIELERQAKDLSIHAVGALQEKEVKIDKADIEEFLREIYQAEIGEKEKVPV